jgi:hypothetical protein
MILTLPYQMVLLVRGESSKTALAVLPHEIDILRFQFGENSVEPVDAGLPNGLDEIELDTADEYARLQDYYRGNGDNPNPTREVFRTLADFEASFTPTKPVKIPLEK